MLRICQENARQSPKQITNAYVEGLVYVESRMATCP